MIRFICREVDACTACTVEGAPVDISFRTFTGATETEAWLRYSDVTKAGTRSYLTRECVGVELVNPEPAEPTDAR